MANGYQRQAAEGMDQLVQILGEARRRLRELEALDGTQIYDTVQNLQNLIDGLLHQVNGIFTGYVTAGTSITAGGNVVANGLLYSPGSSTVDVSTLPGSRQATWQLYTGANLGLFGYAPSTFRKKTHWRKTPYTAEQFLSCMSYLYEFRGQIAIRDDKHNANYDPAYVVPTEVGYMSELLIKNGLGQFVLWRDGEPSGIDYAAFAAVGFTTIGREHAARLAALEARLEAAGL